MGRPPKPLDPSASQEARLGAAIRRRREQRGTTQEQLAEAIGFSRPHLALVELGKAHASEELVRRCDEALEASGGLLGIYPDVLAERERRKREAAQDRRQDPRTGALPATLQPCHGTAAASRGGWMARAQDRQPTTRDDVLPRGARQCFACGEDNPIGLHLADIRRDGDEVRATLHPRPELQSYPGVLHGGVVTTVLDEVMAYASILLAGIWSATATLQVRFRRPVPYDVPLEAVAGVTAERARRVRAWARLELPDGQVGAEATGLLVPLPPKVAARARAIYGPLA
jgi:acyl-coenzyme A thioesterase PaaI-like protein/transcriptional regulator with XRE-family HTH domain